MPLGQPPGQQKGQPQGQPQGTPKSRSQPQGQPAGEFPRAAQAAQVPLRSLRYLRRASNQLAKAVKAVGVRPAPLDPL